jgi:hypothetical protein
MKDLYLKATSRTALETFLANNGLTLEGNYLQTADFILDWIGKIPKTIDEEGNVIEWFTSYRFNVRLLTETTLFDGFTHFEPETPFRMFS